MTYEHKQLGVIEEKAAVISDAGLIMQFIYGGKAVFTIVSTETGKRFTYRVNEKTEAGRPTVYFVGLLAGPDNESDYTYLGWIKANQFALTKKSRDNGLTDQTPSVRAFAWAFGNFAKGVIPEKLEFWHAGRCARCGRPLTVPESISNGFGPECITKVGVSMGNQPVTNKQAASAAAGSQMPLSADLRTYIVADNMAQTSGRTVRNDSFVVRPAVHAAPSDQEVRRMVAALRGSAPENFTMDGEMTQQEAENFWFKRYKKQPLTEAQLSEMEAR